MTTLATSPATPREEHKPARQSGFRPDIEGLRAVAIGAVLIYHAGLPFLPGGFIGVDIFFVISGFLITGLLVREVERTGRVSLTQFYARRAKRLLPATALVLTATAAIVWFTSSVTEWRTFGGDIVAAAAYVVNWRLADRSVDYLAEGTTASPVQHFWSLAVEEQFYIVWPLLLVLVTLLVRRTGFKVRPLMGIGLAVIVVPSFVWSVLLTNSNQATAFFVTTTRLWELGIGALVAVGAGLWPRLPAVATRILGWAGLATLVGAALLLDGSYAWPGSWALVPTLATAAIIIAGAGSSPSTVQRLLSAKPAVWIGGLSYSLYLWHWPLLIGYENLYGTPSPLEGTLLMAASFIPAWLSLKLVENPVRFSGTLARSNRTTLSVGANLTAVGILAGLVVMLAVPQGPPAGAGDAEGARSLTVTDGRASGIENPDSVDSMVPGPVDAVDDVPAAYGKDCQADQEATTPKFCEFGDPDGERTMVLAGDSKALQWSGAFDELARQEGWRLVTATKSSCGLYDVLRNEGGQDYTECLEHNRALTDALIEMKPDVVVVSQRHDTAIDPTTGETTEAAMTDGLVRVWDRLGQAGIHVVALLDNPSPANVEVGDGEVYKCVAERLDQLSDCAFGRADGIAASGTPALVAAAEKVPAVDVLDLTDLFCDEQVCPPVIGGVLVYRQGSHITNTYALSAVPVLTDRLVPLLSR
ncbi:SGNH hydrolase domain-containing protein [Promicromonospora sukumoe]|uniref:Peptidoglycan/LPS O-acetylase OafA/YrhL n=1 Tax=Promicromonospora sukumoe TaxID=88382 RepID=A0A7W3JBW9_9MICO|nr:acyltransferase family protein [Promicromonospora sukumoe]MBA8810016.1 peptidoglycan/LPS O-acetylase OafA/YrhL [Promicromonospora sukumoe]